MKLVFRLLSVVGAVSTVAAANASFTVGTFADPAANSSQNFFSFVQNPAGGGGTLFGSWLTDGLNLLTPGIVAPDQMNVRFELRDIQNNLGLDMTLNNNLFLSETGYVRFFDAANTTVLRIDFNTAIFQLNGFAASDLFGNTVAMSGSIVEPGWSQESFGFSFANWQQPTNGVTTFSGAFTSSAVPEPATMAVLGLGVAALARRRRK